MPQTSIELYVVYKRIQFETYLFYADLFSGGIKVILRARTFLQHVLLCNIQIIIKYIPEQKMQF